MSANACARSLASSRFGTSSRAYGLELAIHDRTLTRISTTDGEPELTVDVNVAGPAALLIAKAHKVSERLADFEKRPDRLRPKDSGDIMMVTDGAEMGEAMLKHVAATRKSAPSYDGVRYLVDMYSAGNDTIVREHMAASLSARFPEPAIDAIVNEMLGWSGTRSSPVCCDRVAQECRRPPITFWRAVPDGAERTVDSG